MLEPTLVDKGHTMNAYMAKVEAALLNNVQDQYAEKEADEDDELDTCRLISDQAVATVLRESYAESSDNYNGKYVRDLDPE